jgi:glycosyltransferase involved in cell wall biosynthesis
MIKQIKQILIDCERMKYAQTGLYYYCFHLGQALQQLMQNNQCNPVYYLPKTAQYQFGNNASTIIQKSVDKFHLPSLKDFDLWHATYQGTMYYPYKRNIPIVLTIHDFNFMYDENKSEKKKKKYLEELKRKIDRADAITAISEFTLSEIKKYINLDGKYCTVIHNGCNINEIEQPVLPVILPKVPFLFTIGTITEKKNFHVLAPLLEGNQYHLVIAGITQNEAYKDKIIKEAQKRGVADRIEFTGAISENDKQYYLKYCDAFLFPSLAEGFGLPVLEALYFGKAVFLSESTSLPEIGGPYSYYFKNFEPNYIREVFKKSLLHYNSTMPSEKIKAYANTFSWYSAAEKYVQVYETVLNARGKNH